MARSKTLSDKQILAQIPSANARAQAARRSGMRAAAAHYNDRDGLVMLTLTNGFVFGFPVARIAALKDVPVTELASVRASPSGGVLHWDKFDIDLDVAGLIVSSMRRAAQLSTFG